MSDEREESAREDGIQIYTPLRQRRRHAVYQRKGHPARLIVTLAFLAVLIVGGVRYAHLRTAHYAVMLNGRVLAALATRAQAEEVIAGIARKHAPAAPSMVEYKEGVLTVHALRRTLPALDVETAVAELDQHLNAICVGYAIYVNRRPIVLLGSRKMATQAISLMQERGLGGKPGIPTLKERVTIASYRQEEGDALQLPIVTPQQAAEQLVHPPVPHSYTVKKGDSFWVIANANKLTVADVKKLNPTIDPGALQPGDQIKLPDVPSPVTVIVRPLH